MSSAFRRIVAGACLSTLALAVPLTVQAQDRMALVLDNNAAEGTDEVKTALSQAGYSVLDPGVVNGDGIRWALDVFRRKLERSGPGTAAVVYVRAIGVSDNGRNYLLPVAPETGQPVNLDSDGHSVDVLLEALAGPPGIDAAVVLDICPDDRGSADLPAFTAPIRSKPSVHVADCRSPDGQAANQKSMPAIFAEAMRTPGLTLKEVIAKTDRGGAPRIAAGGGEGNAEASSLEAVLWAAIKDAETQDVFEEYLQRFPDGRYVADAETRLAALRRTDTGVAAEDGGAPPEKPGTTAHTTTGLSSKSFTATLHGTGEPGWANLYLKVCGEDIEYDMELKRVGKTWSAQLTHQKNGDVVHFKQREKTNHESMLLYGNYGAEVTKYTVILRLTPTSGRKITFSIPNAGIGNCAFGYLN